ncbi:MAG: pyridoxal phosphate-dependent aminotransferase, partial [Desulfofundulus sp.]
GFDSMIQPARKLNNIPFSPIRKVFAVVEQLRAEGKDVISLGIGEPDFDTPPHITEAMAEAARRGATHYTNNKGIIELRRAICEKLKKDNGLSYDPEEEIICTVGVSEGVYIALTSFLNPGDEVLVPDPAWLNYTHVPVMNEATPVPYRLSDENGFQIDVSELEEKVTERTKILVVLDPSNPTGAVQKREVLEKVAEFAIKHDLLVISDEIYEKIIYDDNEHVSIASFPGMRERTIVLNGFAKAYAMTGWRLGYVAAPKELIQAMNRLHMYSVTSASSMVQWGGVAALTGPQEPVAEMVAEFKRRRDFMVGALNEAKGISCPKPGGAFYLFPNIRATGMTSEEFTNYLLQEANVAVVPGTAFGKYGEGHVRISYATSLDNLKKAAERIQNALSRL